MNGISKSLPIPDYIIIFSFFVMMMIIGIYFSSRMRNMKDYFCGGREIPWWLSGVSFYMSAQSAFTIVAYSAVAYKYGFVAVVALWTTVMAAFTSAHFFAIRWRRAVSTSALDFIEKRFGPGLRQSLAWLSAPMIIVDDGLKIFAIGALVSAGFGFPLDRAIIISALIMLSYTFLGGLWAVIVTDFIQFVVLFFVILFIVPLAFIKVGGIEGFFSHSPEGFFAMTSEKYSWVYLAALAILLSLSYCSRWSLVQRYYSVRTDKDARKVGYLVMLLNFITAPILLFPAMAARMFLPGIENANQVYIIVGKALLPVGMVGLMIVALFSATMSMLAGDYNAVASVLVNDIYKRYIAPKSSDRALVLAGRIATLAIGLVALWIALIVAGNMGDNDLLQLSVKLFSVFIPSIALPMLVGLVSRRVSNMGALCGFFLGIASGVLVYFTGTCSLFGNSVNLRWEPITLSITLSATILGMVLGTLFKPSSISTRNKIYEFILGLESKEVAPTADSSSDIVSSLGGVIGLSVGAMGAIMILVVLIALPFREALMSVIVGSCLIITGILLWKFSKKI